MEKITKPCEPEEEKHILTEGIDYFETGRESIWGDEEKETLNLLNKTEIHGKWLNLAAGDGRFNAQLLKKVGIVVASDIDEGALSKLWFITPKEYKSKLRTAAFDITQKFPFENKSFDGVFCAGTLHMFPKEILRGIFCEINRILKTHGKVFIDFATDIKRVLPNGKHCIRKYLQYKLKEAEEILKENLKNYEIELHESEVSEEEIKERDFSYKFSCKFVLAVAIKK